MKPRSSCPRPRAFSLLEALIVLVLVAVVLGGLAMPLAAQVQLRRHEEVRRQLDEARDVLLGFAAAHGRLPCPATEGSVGLESFAPGGDASNGQCASFHGGFLPAASLGLSGLDAEGFVRDPWQGPRNRVRYAVHAATINGVAHPLTRTHGLQMATLPGLGAAAHYLHVCGSAIGVTPSGCGPAANQLTRRAAFVLFSLGPNAGTDPAPGSDEARNLDGDAVFVSREPSGTPGNEFDDIVQWGAIHLLVSRMLAAGRLP